VDGAEELGFASYDANDDDNYGTSREYATTAESYTKEGTEEEEDGGGVEWWWEWGE